MLKVYPFASGSEYTSSFALTSSYSPSASLIQYVTYADTAKTVLTEVSGSRGKSMALLTWADYQKMVNTGVVEQIYWPAV